MTMKNLLIIICVLFAGSPLFAQENEYIGAAKCKMCHNKPETGKQYDIWKASGHAKAFETLKGAEAIKIGQAKGIADPSKDQKCLKCHSTYHSVKADAIETLTATEGVSCESCHGPGSLYKVATIMKDQKAAMAKGLVMPTEATCKKCHNPESPNFKGFNFKEYAAKIAHNDPTIKK